MKIGLLTYNHPHRKTQDVLFRLLCTEKHDITLIVLPWEERNSNKPIYQHRPENVSNMNLHPYDLSISFNLGYDVIGHLKNYQFDRILICGAGILHSEIVKNNFIINAHPGYLPNARGLDAMKWSILQGIPIGVTVYRIGADADTGQLIDRSIMPIYHEDTFHSVAQRLYDTEIDMLVKSINQDVTDELLLSDFPVSRRMPYYQEMIMIERFEQMRRNAQSRYETT